MSLTRRQFLGLGAGLSLGAMLSSAWPVRALTDVASRRNIRLIRRGRADLPQIALTFDDCWFEAETLRIASAFAERDVKVTFFPAGTAIRANIDSPTDGHEDLYPRLYEMGHEFGCHTFTHPDITELTAHRLVWWEIQPWIDVLNEALGFEYQPVSFRPPYGIITDALFDACWQTQLDVVLWSADLNDGVCAADTCQSYMTRRMVDLLENDNGGNGELILQHTTPASVDFVDAQLDIIEAAELEPVLISEMLAALDEEETEQS
ncbi:MAG: polysaccharide deacetylase family protein [Anaerolineaceae bacterium]|nr:MAG: polysaccharide deacetylase family protein [Anaerolineaceae bacterium]